MMVIFFSTLQSTKFCQRLSRCINLSKAGARILISQTQKSCGLPKPQVSGRAEAPDLWPATPDPGPPLPELLSGCPRVSPGVQGACPAELTFSGRVGGAPPPRQRSRGVSQVVWSKP